MNKFTNRGHAPVVTPAGVADAAADRPQVVGLARPVRVPWPAVVVFVLTACALAWLVAIPLWTNGKGLGDAVMVQVVAAVMMLTPALATIVALIVQRRGSDGTRIAKARYLGIWPLRSAKRVVWMTVGTYFAVMAFVFVTILFAGAVGWADLDLAGLSGFREYLASTGAIDPGKPFAAVPFALIVAIQLASIPFNGLFTALFAFGEEVGWRGWLLTSLRPLGTWPALVITGAVWGVWHSPLILLGYNFGRTDIGGVALMTGGCIAFGILLGWTRLRTGSVWPAVFGHAALNVSTGPLILLTYQAGTVPNASTTSALGFSGWIVTAVIVAALLLTGQFSRQAELAPARPQAVRSGSRQEQLRAD
ncbi:CPBP family intramembrane metalloprotease [Saxibacter everestensis]|uniref:CPBP family intramembrane metalloprotease n=1 Tax=Saxibacter everestensis TaxID=2909229 RepID=A0ABY8QVT1_9MICO|nr:CPBP family intramembrane metalloprotease [Brevibacteriaceae bacterium ZFBP1038]